MNLNTESIINDVTKVVQNGLKDILSEIETKYKLYEESHNCVVKMAECMSKQVKQDGTSVVASAKTADVDTGIYVSRAEFNALAKQNQELIKHIACEFVSQSKQNQDMLKQLAIMKHDMAKLAIMKHDMASLLSRAVIDVDSDEESNITLKIEEIKTNDNLIGGSLETLDDKIVVAGDKQEEEESDEEEEESDEEEEESDEEDEKVDSVKIVQLDVPITNDGGVITASEVDVEEEEEEEEEEDSDEEKEQLDDDDKEEELYEIVFNSTTYCTDDDNKGSLYILTSDGDVGDKVGHLVNGKPIFY
jgi:hypothetical protein